MKELQLNAPGEELQSFFQAVGSIVVTWGTVEQTFDICVDILFHCGGSELEKRQPHGLKQRIQFARKCLNRIPKFAPQKEPLGGYIDFLEECANERHDFIHSAITEYNEETGAFEAIRMKNDGFTLNESSVSFNPDDYPVLLEKLLHLVTQGHRIAISLLANYAAPNQRPENTT